MTFDEERLSRLEAYIHRPTPGWDALPMDARDVIANVKAAALDLCAAVRERDREIERLRAFIDPIAAADCERLVLPSQNCSEALPEHPRMWCRPCRAAALVLP